MAAQPSTKNRQRTQSPPKSSKRARHTGLGKLLQRQTIKTLRRTPTQTLPRTRVTTPRTLMAIKNNFTTIRHKLEHVGTQKRNQTQHHNTKAERTLDTTQDSSRTSIPARHTRTPSHRPLPSRNQRGNFYVRPPPHTTVVKNNNRRKRRTTTVRSNTKKSIFKSQELHEAVANEGKPTKQDQNLKQDTIK